MRRWLLIAVAGFGVAAGFAAAPPEPIFDAHIHYSADAWERLDAAEAVRRLRAAGVTGALVSSSSDEGTQRLLAAGPDLVIPSLRPYRKRGETSSWLHDESVPGYLEERLRRHRYVALGEFHASGAEADLPVMRRVVALAREHGLLLHAHSDADAIDRIFAQDPQARVLWAHAGFESTETVADRMRRYATLWADLSFRGEVAVDNVLAPEWRALFLEFPGRFMVGTDTYTPSRWDDVGRHAEWAKGWLAQLPPEVARRIARGNAEAVLVAPYRAGALNAPATR